MSLDGERRQLGGTKEGWYSSKEGGVVRSRRQVASAGPRLTEGVSCRVNV